MERNRKIISITIFSACTLLTFILFLKFAPQASFIFITGECLAISAYMTLRSKLPDNLRALVFNLTMVFLTLCILEIYYAGWLRFKPPSVSVRGGIVMPAKVFRGDFTKKGRYFTGDEIRGYAARKNVRVTAKAIINNKTAYDVVYTTNKYGLRVTPHDLKPTNLNPDFKNVLFFGCSFTFGEGVNDEESLPFLFEEKSQGRFKAYNFGFHGYGPHQMLRILESGLIDTIVTDKKPAIAIYQALTDHIARISLRYPYVLWDIRGPRYKLTATNDVVFTGNTNILLTLLHRQLVKSYIFKNILAFLFDKPRTQNDITLFVQIIKKSKQIFESRYSGKFYVVYLDYPDPDIERIISQLEKEDIKVMRIINGYENIAEFENKYKISQEGHPNSLAYNDLAEYLLSNLQF